MVITKRFLAGLPSEDFNIRLPAIPITARLDGDGRMCVWFMIDETQLIAVKRTVCLQSSGAPFPNESLQFMAHMGMFLRATKPPNEEDGPGYPASELHVFYDMSSQVQITNDGGLVVP